MITSESVKEISAALVKFHEQMGIVKKESVNSFLKNRYAPLPDILQAIKEPLLKNGLAIVQFPEGEHGLTTRLVHTSGEWMEATYFMKPKQDTPQEAGSAITYQRRYAVGAILSLSIDDDDDGNAASGKGVDYDKLLKDCKTVKDVVSVYNRNKPAIDADPKLQEKLAKRRNELTPVNA